MSIFRSDMCTFNDSYFTAILIPINGYPSLKLSQSRDILFKIGSYVNMRAYIQPRTGERMMYAPGMFAEGIKK